ncbi:TPA: iron ABC transporter permease [Corynebacterium striatum]|nr:iron ABC transporter permease [Corynebacterium striatum]HAT1331962.1 iron ABC transporter permease [Corynebacterium striatum]HAT1339335.1 iron ABC transporter permease [Corynebacterium striatum]HAT1362427.1 iron ABC transporter permease [Corynebacterium striatum]HAT1367410.1 iron ABC transporter permease [Corynebacterium striatum]
MTRPREEASPVRLPRLLVVALIAAILVILLTFASILIGSRPLGLTEIMALVSGSGSEEVRTLVGEVRLPRTLAGMLVGAALAWAGALMQAMTRNPLADPGLLGVGSGAAFAVTIGMSWLGLRSAFGIAASAIIGAAAVTTVVLILGLRGRADGSRLILAGVAFSMTVSGIQSAITLLNPRALDAMRAWSAGSLASPDSKVIAFSLPILAVGALIAFLLVRPMDALALGDDLARGLGSHPLATRIGTGLATVCLVGAATAIAGPIGFIGLMVPHIVRPFTGPRTAPLLLISTFTGAGLVLTADILSRIVLWPGEIPVGIVSAALGALVMLVLLRRRR